MSKITKLIDQLRKYTSIKGNLILDELIDEILKELEKTRIVLKQPKKGGE